MSIRVLSDGQHRILAFVEACNRGGYSPAVEDVLAWIERPEATALDRYQDLEDPFSRLSSGLAMATRDLYGIPNPVEHLIRLGWLTPRPLRLTRLGAALLASGNARRSIEDSLDSVVLSREDPVSYPKLIGEVAKLGESGLLVDPYLGVEQLHQVLAATSLQRILISKQRKDSQQIRAEIATYLGAQATRHIEVRASADSDVHDRYLVSDSAIKALGHSLNGVANGTASTVIVALPEPAASAQRKRIRKWWNDAEVVEPIAPTAVDEQVS